MLNHLRANLCLLVLTVLICAVLYPLALWGIGQTVFRDQAQGSIITDGNGKPVGSLLIAQEFKGDEYLQPRPSAASYNAAASGASNYGANNYLLRERVARQLGPIVRYGNGAEKEGKKPGELVGPDVEKWFQQDRCQEKPGIVQQWAAMHGSVAEGWIKDTDLALKPQWKVTDREREAGQSFLQQLAKDDPQLHQGLVAALKDPQAANTAELSQAFFPLFSKRYPGEWLTVEDDETKTDEKRKKLVRGKESSDIQGIFFDMWRQEHADVPLEEVPADMVTTSASGLDPHITLKNAQYQLKYRIPEARAKKIILEQAKKLDKDFDKLEENQRKALQEQARKVVETKVGKHLEDRLTEVIDRLLTEKAAAPLGGLVGIPLVNVLEVNLALDKRLNDLLETGK
jgi:potassium-transporting ATPase KdpC subunit